MSSIRLMIVEAAPGIREHLNRRLEDEFLIHEPDSGKPLPRVIKQNNIDVVVVICGRIDRELENTIGRIRKMRKAPEIILIHNTPEPPAPMTGMKLGVFDDFQLPLDVTALIRRIREAFYFRKSRKRFGTILETFQKTMAAAALAESGEHEMAIQFMEKRERDSHKNEQPGGTAPKTNSIDSKEKNNGTD